MKSPVSNGLSKKIVKKQKISVSALCAANATATPPMPRPATSDVILTPILSRNSTSAINQITPLASRISHLMASAALSPLPLPSLVKTNAASEEKNTAPIAMVNSVDRPPTILESVSLSVSIRVQP